MTIKENDKRNPHSAGSRTKLTEWGIKVGSKPGRASGRKPIERGITQTLTYTLEFFITCKTIFPYRVPRLVKLNNLRAYKTS